MIDYTCREFQANAIWERMLMGFSIECYPSRYTFRKRMLAIMFLERQKGCMRCGKKGELEIDHILPESKFPELALDEENIQLLCRSCNASKGNRDYTNYK